MPGVGYNAALIRLLLQVIAATGYVNDRLRRLLLRGVSSPLIYSSTIVTL